MNDLKDALVKLNQRNCIRGVEKPVLELECKQRGRPSALSPSLNEELKRYILEL